MPRCKCILLLLSISLTTFYFPKSALMAQSSDTFYIKAKLSPDNEVPQIAGLEGVNGSARIKVTINQDAAGTIKSGSVEFALGYQFSRSVTLTGLHIHLGGVGENGPVVIDSQLSETAVPDGNGNLVIATPLLSTPEQVSRTRRVPTASNRHQTTTPCARSLRSIMVR